jgi:methionyl-tRNA formyltransferase
MLLTAGMDEGPLLAQAPYELTDTITTPQLTDALIELSDACLKEILPLWYEGTTQAAPQEDVTLSLVKEPTYSRKLTKDDGVIDWSKDAAQIEREVRAFQGWPKSRTTFGSTEVIITKAHVIPQDGTTGERTVLDKRPAVFCGSNALAIDALKPAGKKEMTGEAFLAGYKSIFLSSSLD